MEWNARINRIPSKCSRPSIMWSMSLYWARVASKNSAKISSSEDFKRRRSTCNQMIFMFRLGRLICEPCPGVRVCFPERRGGRDDHRVNGMRAPVSLSIPPLCGHNKTKKQTSTDVQIRTRRHVLRPSLEPERTKSWSWNYFDSSKVPFP